MLILAVVPGPRRAQGGCRSPRDKDPPQRKSSGSDVRKCMEIAKSLRINVPSG